MISTDSSSPSLTMTGSSSISGNTAGVGGGLYTYGQVSMTGVMCGPQTLANVSGNTPDDCYFVTP
jgi:hypothetical protein